jgi:serine/threonine protein kinase
VLHQIGSGVLGPVFRTYDPQRDRLVAVKAFRLDIVPEEVARLAESLRRLAASEVRQPTMVAVLDAGLEGTTAYLAMEYVSAETLDVALRHLAPASLDAALPVLSQIAEAVDEGWAAGLGHGALHPRDVFVAASTHEVRVTGFGVVSALESVGVKTPARRPYSAPERVAGEPWDIRADVYSLGAIAHELLTRRRPAGPGEQDGTLATGTSPRQRVVIRRVLSAALAERPEHRFPSARAFLAALSAVAHGETVVTLPEGADEEDGQEARPPAPVPAIVVPTSAESSEPQGDQVVGTASHSADVVPLPSPALGADGPWPLPDPSPAGDVASRPPEVPDSARAGSAAADRWAPKIEGAPAVPVRAARPPSVSLGGPSRGSLLLAPPPIVEAPSFPWLAIGAATVAALVLGGVIGYGVGLRRGRPSPVPAAPVVTARPADTEVTVPEPAAPKTSAAVPALKTEASRDAATTGRLVVRSTPAGAAVLLDGRTRGETPVSWRDLPFGTHTLLLSHAGYAPRSDRVTLSAAEPVLSVALELEPAKEARATTAASPAAPATGSIYVDSHPRGAQILIDGHVFGMTPMAVPGMSPGAHTLRLQLAGHKPLTTSVRVTAGEQAKVAVTLEEGWPDGGHPASRHDRVARAPHR